MAEAKSTGTKDTSQAKDSPEGKDKSSGGGRKPRTRTRKSSSTLDRAGETAIETKDRFAAFAKEHPITTVAGGLALGILISGLFRGSPTRKVAEKVGSRAADLASVGAELAMAYATTALAAADDARKTGADKLGDFGEAALSYGKAGTDSATEVARSAGRRIAKAVHGRFN